MNKSIPEKPSSTPIYIGIDLGTSGIRISAINEDKYPIAELSITLPASRIDGPAISQNPSDWQTSLLNLFEQLHQQINLTQIKALAIDGTSGTVLLTDKQGQPVSEALMYNDARSLQQVEQLRVITQNSVVQNVSAGLPKLMWLTEKYENYSYAMHQADWIMQLFTGQPGHSDINNCLKTGYDAIQQQWPKWLEALPAVKDKLPIVHQPGSVVATISQHAARQFHLPVTTKIIAGTTDSHAAILATGISHTGEAVTSLGSTLVTKVISDTPVFDKDYGVYSQPFADKWLVGGGSNTGGAILRDYFTDNQMLEMTPAIDPQHDTGLNFYPLSRPGERFPVNDPALQPRLEPRPVKDEKFFQAMLEGIARIEHEAYQRLAELGAPYPTLIKSVGGGAKNNNWTHIRQRYCQTRVEQSEYTEACYGSALLARQGYLKTKG